MKRDQSTPTPGGQGAQTKKKQPFKSGPMGTTEGYSPYEREQGRDFILGEGKLNKKIGAPTPLRIYFA